jgi:hypothetical protein
MQGLSVSEISAQVDGSQKILRLSRRWDKSCCMERGQNPNSNSHASWLGRMGSAWLIGTPAWHFSRLATDSSIWRQYETWFRLIAPVIYPVWLDLETQPEKFFQRWVQNTQPVLIQLRLLTFGAIQSWGAALYHSLRGTELEQKFQYIHPSLAL